MQELFLLQVTHTPQFSVMQVAMDLFYSPHQKQRTHVRKTVQMFYTAGHGCLIPRDLGAVNALAQKLDGNSQFGKVLSVLNLKNES